MQDHTISYQIGQWTAIAIVGCVAGGFVLKGFQSPQRSAKFANVSIGFGLLVFFQPHLALQWTAATHPWTFLLMGGLRICLGVAGCVLAVVALTTRGEDQGAGITRCVLGLLFSFLHLIAAVGITFLPSGFQEPEDPWIYRHSHCSVRFFSPLWRREQSTENTISFKHSKRSMFVNLSVQPGDRDALKPLMQRVRDLIQKQYQVEGALIEEQGVNERGCKYLALSGLARPAGEKGLLYFMTTATEVEKTGVVVLMAFEGQVRGSSETLRTSMKSWYEKVGRFTCLSVGD